MKSVIANHLKEVKMEVRSKIVERVVSITVDKIISKPCYDTISVEIAFEIYYSLRENFYYADDSRNITIHGKI